MPIWPFGSKSPKLQDQAFSDLAQMFLSDRDDPTPGSESLNVAQCDFSLESLRVIDAHLEAMRGRHLEGQAMMKLVLRCGAYVGEVVRRHVATGTPWHWITYDDAVKLDARLASLGQSLGAAAVLWDGEHRFVFPLARVGRYLENGAEDSVRVRLYRTKRGMISSPIILRQRSWASRSAPLTPTHSLVAPRSASCSMRAIQSRGAPASAQRSIA
jgi:hypothetical protein